MAGNFLSSGVYAAFTLCILASVAQAQSTGAPEAPVPAPDSSQTQPPARAGDEKILDPISVTATRNPIRSFEYPGMVSVIGREELQTRQPSTPDDILKFVPNVEFYGGPRKTGEAPSIRGFSGADVIVLLDGARQNFGSTHDGRFFIDPSLLKRVEVLRGAASSLYGSGGIGGVFDFGTLDAADLLDHGQTMGVSLSAGYQGVNRERVGSLTAYGRPGNGLDFVGSVTKRDSGTISLGDGNELTDTDDDIVAGLAKASFKIGDHHRIEGALVSFNNTAQEPNNGQGSGDGTAVGLVDKDIQSMTFRAAYGFRNPYNDLVDLGVVVYRTDMQADELRLDDDGIGPTGELIKRDVDTTGIRLDNRSRFKLSDTLAATLTYGGEFYRDSQDGAAGDSEREGVPDADASFHGVFAQAEVTLSEPFGVVPGDFLIIPGVRYDEYKTSSSIADDNSESEVSPRVGVSYLPTDWLMVFANYAQAFRAPTINEIYLTGTHFRIPLGQGSIVNRFVPNPDLKPQTTRTVEVGGGMTFEDALQPQDKIQVKTSRFWLEGEDFFDLSVDQPAVFGQRGPLPQCLVPGACDGTTTSSNVANAKLHGTEIEASYENARALVALGFSTIDGENEDTGDKLGVLTPNQFTVNGMLKLPEIDAVLGWRILSAGEFDKVNNPDEERDAYTVHDFYFAWRPSGKSLKGLRVDLGVDNAFDKAFSRVFTDVTEAGRNFKALVSYSLKW